MLRPAVSLERPGFSASGLLPRYALSVIAVAAAGAGTALLEIVIPGVSNLFFFFAAVVVTAWYAGAGPGWVSVFLSALAVGHYFVPPVMGVAEEGFSWFAAFFVSFIICGAVTNAVSVRQRRVEHMLRRSREELEERVRAHTQELRQINDRLIAEMIERIRAETTLRQTQTELARSARMMNLAELAASIAHEVNQPLTAVVANGEAARNWMRRSPPAIAEARESIEAVVTAGVRAAQIIARIRGLITKSIPRQTVIDVNSVVSEVLNLAGGDLARRNIITKCRLAPALPSIIGDRVQLQQMLLNLINNASDAMADITDRQRELVIATRMRGEARVSITVEDSGHGLAEADTSAIFQAFYSKKQGGMGIGLSVCRTVVESHGGSIRAMARLPHGAILEVDLPARARDG
jgi:C4-dicarboxylate-specific signal transduction histidine kinase